MTYSATGATEAARVESAAIMSDGRTLDVRGVFNTHVLNLNPQTGAEVHVEPTEDGLTVWVAFERYYPEFWTLAGCLESTSEVGFNATGRQLTDFSSCRTRPTIPSTTS